MQSLSTHVSDREARETAASCHSGPQVRLEGLPLIAIVGNPNVGKSVLFNKLTGAYVTVSNFPGTTVEISQGKGRIEGTETGVVDTPGMYRLLPISEEERVARRVLLEEQPDVVVHIVDAKNLERMLPMTLQLIEAGLPVVLDVNLMDEAERAGVELDVAALQRRLGIPVVGTALVHGRGLDRLHRVIDGYLGGEADAPFAFPPEGEKSGSAEESASDDTPLFFPPPRGEYADAPFAFPPEGEKSGSAEESASDDATLFFPPRGGNTRGGLQYNRDIEEALENITSRMTCAYRLSDRAMALLLLQDDAEVAELIREGEGDGAEHLMALAAAAREKFTRPISYVVARQLQQATQRLLDGVISEGGQRTSGFARRLSAAMINPVTGIPILLLVLYLLYQFVGVLGAQTLVDFLEESVFGAYINPWVDRALTAIIPWPWLRSLFGGEYGIITLGVRYAVALILPIVGTFFIAFSIIEDSGYLPRLAMLIDRVFKKIGLNGRAVIPMVLGFGCDTMATVVTRTLETKRERLLSTLLLALAIPCSAQLGVMMGLLAGNPLALAIWIGVVTGLFLLVGYLAARVLPGDRPSFYMELPPLRLPTLGNVVVKTYTRMEWYFREVFPMFVVASAVIWLGQLTGVFDLVIGALEPLVRWMGLPEQSAVAFLFGFFRRDYGAAGLYDLRNAMNGVQLVVAATTMTIFIPCIAQFAVTVKERGWKTAVAITAFIFPFAFLVGGALNWVLTTLGVGL